MFLISAVVFCLLMHEACCCFCCSDRKENYEKQDAIKDNVEFTMTFSEAPQDSIQNALENSIFATSQKSAIASKVTFLETVASKIPNKAPFCQRTLKRIKVSTVSPPVMAAQIKLNMHKWDDRKSLKILKFINLNVLHPSFGVNWYRMIDGNPERWVVIMGRITAAPQPSYETRKWFGEEHGIKSLETILDKKDGLSLLMEAKRPLEWWARLPAPYLQSKNHTLFNYLAAHASSAVILKRRFQQITLNTTL